MADEKKKEALEVNPRTSQGEYVSPDGTRYLAGVPLYDVKAADQKVEYAEGVPMFVKYERAGEE
ncbi:MAG: hypothetical protein WKF67_15045 [Rubrobacteraceae bacterium]